MALSQGPTSPGGGMTGGGIDQPPPLPPNMRTPDMSTLAGNYNQGGSLPSGELSVMAMRQGQLANDILDSLGKIVPALVPFIEQSKKVLMQGVAGFLAQQQGSSSNGPVPQGAAGPPPAGAGAVSPAGGGGGSSLGSGPLG